MFAGCSEDLLSILSLTKEVDLIEDVPWVR